MLNDEELTIYQLVDFFVDKYDYQVVGFPQQKNDVYLIKREDVNFPMIRINPMVATSSTLEEKYLERNLSIATAITNIKIEKMLIINTNPESSPFVEGHFQQEIATNTLISPLLLENFPEMKQFVHKAENNDSEFMAIRERLRNLQHEKMKAAKQNVEKPKLTIGIMIVLTVIFVITYILGQLCGDYQDVVIAVGALYNTFIIAAHEYWRFITAGLLHASVFHLIMNLFALYGLGSIVEKMYSKKAYLTILISSMIVGNIFAFILQNNGITVGISGGLFGLMGGCIVATINNGSIRIPQVRNTVIQMLGLNLIISLLPNVSMYAHIGGFITGMAVGFIMIDSQKWKRFKIHAIISTIVLLIGLGYFTVRINTVDKIYPGTDVKVVKLIDKAGFTDYAEYLNKSLNTFYIHEGGY